MRAFEQIRAYYADFFGTDSTEHGLIPQVITDPQEIHDLTAFFSWTAWASAAEREGHDYSYTNNWPPEAARRQRADGRHPRLVGDVAHRPAGRTRGAVRALRSVEPQDRLARRREPRRWRSVSRARSRSRPLRRPRPGSSSSSPCCSSARRVLGGAIEHYRAELSNFFGFDLAQILPFNLARTWHVQLSLLWTAASFLAAGIFLAPIISGREPRRQSWLTYGLLGALFVVVVGTLVGDGHRASSASTGPRARSSSTSSGNTSTCRGSGRSCSSSGCSCGSRSSTARSGPG